MTAPSQLRTESRDRPIGLGNPTPEFSWRNEGFNQTWCEIEVLNDAGDRVWSTGRLETTRPFGNAYSGPALQSASRYHWRVRAGDELLESDWSERAWFEMGLLDQDDWTANWITDSASVDSRRTLYFQASASLPSGIVRARIYASALGWYRLRLNGEDLTGHTLVPRWTSFDHEVEYQAYDVTDHVRAGENTIGVVVGEGRFRGKNSYESRDSIFGDRLATIVQLEATLEDGTTIYVNSDSSWLVGGGRILTADHKHGERVDARLADFDGQAPPINAVNALVLPRHPRQLISEDVERVGEIGRVSATEIASPNGTALYDFGQNFAGVARVQLTAPRGTKVRFSYSEVLTKAGDIDVHYLDVTKPSTDWFQRDEVIVGDSPLDYTPSFSLFGFRYLAIDSDTPNPNIVITAVEGIQISTALAQRASMTTSHEGLNKLWENTSWSLRSNFLDTATDCPTRERSGWTGDIQIFAPTASIFVQSDNYLRRYLHNLALDQFEDGSIPVVIPREWSSRLNGNEGHQYGFRSATGWGDAAVMVPLTLHKYFGDATVLERQYASARAWVDHVARNASSGSGFVRRFQKRAGDLESFVVDTGRHFGEWLRPGEDMMRQMIKNSIRPPAEVATAYFAHSAKLLSQMASILEKTDDAKQYEQISGNARTAYRRAFVSAGGSRIGADKQDDYARALAFDLLDPHETANAADRLVELIRSADNHIGTGFLSTPLLLGVLVKFGHPDIAYDVLLQETGPSWLNQVSLGATSMWETWAGYDKEGNAKMSQNHYAHGSVSGWMFEHIVGIQPIEAGYRRFRVDPTVGGGLTSASGSIDTGYGTISAAWQLNDQSDIDLTVVVPWGTTAEVSRVPGAPELGPGEHRLTVAR